ncbi:TaqI-like C-terminal specificity domain-containing protein, partial [Sphingobacterium multivorum]|uniref:TaqI-like C-terminal specificity domain-containing protein n=1 Tax=Sphingobacterium multivorum TaxID=28454 RepID=UPI00289EE9E8
SLVYFGAEWWCSMVRNMQLGLKILQNSFFLNDIATNSRGEMLQKHLLFNGKYPVIGGKEIDRYSIKSSKGYIGNKGLITDKAKISTNSVLVQNIVAHITKPFNQIKIIATIPRKQEVVILDTINQITIQDGAFPNDTIWALLNSKIINWFAYLFVFAKAIRTMHFDNSVTERIPIPNNILSKKSELIKLSNRITESKNKNFNADVSELEHQIDQIFYELYTLSDEEIAIIENT